MREFIGHEVKFVVQELGAVKGVIINEGRDRVFVKGEDGKITRVIKSHICAFTPLDFEPEDYVPFHVLYCRNKEMGCPGVTFIQEGEGFKAHDFEAFMGPCPCRADSCAHGTKGELHSVAGSVLREIFADTIYGDYPKKKKEAQSGSTSRSSDAEAECGTDEGAGADAGKEQNNG